MSKRVEEFEGYNPEIQICVQCKNLIGKYILSDRTGFCKSLNRPISACQLEWAYTLDNRMCIDFEPYGLSEEDLKKHLEAKKID